MRSFDVKHLIAGAAVLASPVLAVLAAAADDGSREALRRRLDLQQSAIVLEAKVEPGAAPAFDQQAFVRAVLAAGDGKKFVELDGVPPPPALEGRKKKQDGARAEREDATANAFDLDPRPQDAACGVLRGETERHRVEIKRHDLSFLVRDAGGYDASSSGGPGTPKLLDTTLGLLRALGARDAEAGNSQVRTLMVGTRGEATVGTALPAAGVKTRALGKKVFVRRTLGGIEVAGQSAVASFGLDGTFRKLRGRWSAIAYDQSQLGTSLDEKAFVERALDALVERGIATDTTLPIQLMTYFRPSAMAACGSVRVDLRGMALVQTRGPDGALGRLVQVDFDV